MNTVRIASGLLLILVMVAANAQSPGGSRGGRNESQGMGRDQRAPREAPRQDRASAGATIQALLDAIEDDLKLTEAQRPLWYGFADPVQKVGDTMSRLRFEARTGTAVQGGSAPEQLERIADDERRRLAAIEQIVAAARALYAVLTPEQRRIADARFANPVLELTFGAISTREEPRGRQR